MKYSNAIQTALTGIRTKTQDLLTILDNVSFMTVSLPLSDDNYANLPCCLRIGKHNLYDQLQIIGFDKGVVTAIEHESEVISKFQVETLTHTELIALAEYIASL